MDPLILRETPGLMAGILAGLPPFRGLDADQLRLISDLGQVSRHGPGEVIFDEGLPTRRFYLLLAGHIRLLRITAEGAQIILLHIPAGQIFGICRAFDQSFHQSSAVAAGACAILSWPNELWAGFAARYPGFAANALQAYAARADEVSNRLVEMATMLVDQRVACALLRLMTHSGRQVADGVEIRFPITRQNISDMTGTTLHTVSRLLSSWEKQGLIQSTRCRIVVTDAHRLVMISGTAWPDVAQTPLCAITPRVRAIFGGKRAPHPESAGI